VKKQKENRFANLAKDLAEFKQGKSKIKVTTLDPVGREGTVHMESYEEMRARHETKSMLTTEEEVETERRLADHHLAPDSSIPLDEMRARLRSRFAG